MRKQVFGRQFKRDINERKALFSGLVSAMVQHGKIKTTEQKAKAVKGDVEKIVTKAKKDEASARRLLKSILKEHEIDKMINEIAPRFKNRPGGYTRIIKTGKRFNDNASMVIMEWVEGSTDAKALAGKEEVGAVKKLNAPKTKTIKKAIKKTVKFAAKAKIGKKEKK